MSEPLINNKIGAENQKFFLNKEFVWGVQSVQGNLNLGLEPLSYGGIGSKTLNYIPKSEQTTNLNINTLLINKDYFFNLVTGSSLVNLYILRNQSDLENNYILHSGYFNQYSSSYSIGGSPNVSTTCIAVKDGGKIPTGNLSSDALDDLSFISTGNFSSTGFLIPSMGSISLSIDTFSSNRLQSYSVEVSANKIPVYIAGQKHPKKIENLYSDIQCSFSFEIGLYELKRLRNFPQSGVVKDLAITVKDYSNEQIIHNYNFSNLNLIDESFSVSSNENILVSQVYQTRIYA